MAQSPVSSITRLLFLLILVVGAIYFSLKVRNSVEEIQNTGQSDEPGEEAYRAANQMLAPATEGASHGNSLEATNFAADLLGAIDPSGMGKAFCRISGERCVFLVRVSGVSKLDDAERKELVDRAWGEGSKLAASLDPIPSELAVGVKGPLTYIGILQGGVSASDPMAEVVSRAKGIGEIKTLFPFFE